MINEDWELVEEAFHKALSLPPEERKAYITRELSGDSELAADVESLLTAFEEESQFLDEPVFDLGLGVLHEDPNTNLTGTTIDSYKVLEKLGSGGMGEVYKALDTTLNRTVALKFLSKSFNNDKWAKRQFIKEAQAAAMLDHPNICAVYGIEQTEEHNFIVMQYVEGVTLSESIYETQISKERAISIACQITEAVAFAHSHGVIHRDLKPGNIMISNKGRIKVLDFGLAKIIQQKQQLKNNFKNTSFASRSGLIMGTVGYMSPEQLRAERLDYRSDIFSVGIILYELFGKQNPFNQKSQAETIASILGDAPKPLKTIAPEVPVGLSPIIRKCLSKDKEKRFQSAIELLIELENLKNDTTAVATIAAAAHNSFRRLRRSGSRKITAYLGIPLFLLLIWLTLYFYAKPSAKITTLAVMPVINESNQPDKDYVGDGLMAELVNKLSRLSNLKVKSPASLLSTPQPQRKSLDAQSIGRQLGADKVLTGKIVLQKNGLVFQARIINTSDGAQTWIMDYPLDETNLLPVEDRFSSQTISEINPSLDEKERKFVAKHRTDSAEANNFYMKGQYYWFQRDGDGNLKAAIECFKKATELDPGYSEAWAGLADSYALFSTPSFNEALAPADAAMYAKAAAKIAIQLDDTSGAPFTSLGIIKSRYDWDWQGAENDFKTAIALDPEYIPTYYSYSRLLALRGRYDEALTFANKARELDPFSLQSEINIGHIYFYARNYEQAAQVYSRLLNKNPDNKVLQYSIGWLYLQSGRTKEAIDIFEKIHVNYASYADAGLGYAYARDGRTDDALKIIAELDQTSKVKFISPQEKAIIYIGLNDKDKAFENLNSACAERFAALPHLIADDPLTDPLRADPRFADLIRCVNLQPGQNFEF